MYQLVYNDGLRIKCEEFQHIKDIYDCLTKKGLMDDIYYIIKGEVVPVLTTFKIGDKEFIL
jgi:hypothetical protein